MSKFLNEIFFRLPYFARNVIVSFKGALNAINRKGAEYERHLQAFRTSWAYTSKEIEQLQMKKLKDLILEVVTYSPFYRESFEELWSVSDIDHVSPFVILKTFPFLEKKDIRTSYDKIENQNPSRKRDVISFTSGSTGTPLTTYYDKESVQLSFALWRRFHDSIGLPQSFKSVRFSGKLLVNPKATKKPFWAYNYYDKQLLMSTYHLTQNNLPFYVDELNQFKPALIDGYPSAITIIANHILDSKLKLSFQPAAIVTTAETLSVEQRFLIERAFNTKVFNQYASSEGAPFITECRFGKYHLNLDSGHFEFLSLKGGTPNPGEYAELVVTSFRSYKTPLLRYKTNDIVMMSQSGESCTCGCSMPIVSDIIGRQDDILFTTAKGYVGRMDTAYKGLSGILASKIVQSSIDSIDVYQVIDSNYNATIEQILIRNLRDRLGDQIRIIFHEVSEIPTGKNGKMKSVQRTFALPTKL